MRSNNKVKPTDSSSEDLPTWNTSDKERERVAELRLDVQRHRKLWQTPYRQPVCTRMTVRIPCAPVPSNTHRRSAVNSAVWQTPRVQSSAPLLTSQKLSSTPTPFPRTESLTRIPQTSSQSRPTRHPLTLLTPTSGERASLIRSTPNDLIVTQTDNSRDDIDNEADDEADDEGENEHDDEEADEEAYEDQDGGVDTPDPEVDLGADCQDGLRRDRARKKWRSFYERHRDDQIERGKLNYRRRKAREEKAGQAAIEAGRQKRREVQARYREKNRALLAQKERERRHKQRQS